MSGLFGSKTSNASQSQQAAGIRVQTSVYGTPIKLVYGTNRITGNLIWYGDFTATKQSQSGGKGGGGGKGSSTYTYSAAVAIALCEGPITGIGVTWAGQNTYDWGSAGYGGQLGFSLFTGTYPQAPWGYLTSNFAGQDLGYEGLAYVANPNLDLGTTASLPNYSFEVIGLLTNGVETDVSPASVIQDFLTDPNHGVGWNPAWIEAGFLSEYATYCAALGWVCSPVFESQTEAQQAIQDMLDASNATCWWSEGVLKIAPYADQTIVGNGVTYTPNTTPVYALDDDDFIYTEGKDPVQITRSSPADAYNIVDVQYSDRDSDYASAVAEAKDLYSVSLYGARYDTVRDYSYFIPLSGVAQTSAQLLLQRDLYIRNTYQFTLGWTFCGLDLMDIVTITDTRLGLNNLPVRITSIEEDSNGNLAFSAEDFPIGFATAPQYSVQAPSGYQGNWNTPAPSPNQVIFYEPPGTVTNNQTVLWVGVGGTGDWGGCQVWVSLDGDTYTNQGTIDGTSRVGLTTSVLPVGSDPDTTDVLGVDLTNSAGTLSSGTQSDADNYNTLCLIGEELISFETAALTSTSQYNLSYLRRGAYGTAQESWPAGMQFMRCDQNVFSYPFDSSLIGKPVYVKLVSFNQYGGGFQDLSTVPVYTYTVLGSGVNAALENVSNVYTSFVADITQLFWDPITDYRDFDYEVRIGSTWGSAISLGRTTQASFPTSGDGTYWVAAHYRNPNGYDVYSPSPADILVSGSIIAKNNLGTYDQAALGWPGTLSGGAGVAGGALTLAGSGNMLNVANVFTMTDVINYGGTAASGGYALPSGQTINAQRVAECSVRITCTAYAQSLTDNMLAVPNMLSATDVLDAANGQYITVTPQIAIAGANGVFGSWQTYKPGSYTGQYFMAQLLMTTSNQNVTPLVEDFIFAVDIDTRTDTFTNQAIPSGGETLNYPSGTFNSGPNGAATPNVQVSVLNAQTGDTVVISGKTLSQVTIQVTNGGTGVARTVDIAVTGY